MMESRTWWIILLLVGFLISACTTAPGSTPEVRSGSGHQVQVIHPAHRWSGSTNLHLGGRIFQADLSPVRSHHMFGVDVAVKPPEWPIELEAMVSGSAGYKENVRGTRSDEEATVSEFGVGVRKTFGSRSFRPYLGTGIALSRITRQEVFSGHQITDDDTGVGFYLHAGFAIPVSSTFQVGANVRANLGTEYDLFGRTVDGDSLAFAFTAGWYW